MKDIRPNFGCKLARISWAAPFAAAFSISLLTQAGLDQAISPLVTTALSSLIYVVGLGCGIVALFRIRLDGRQGVLVPALIGIVLSSLLILFVVTVFVAAVQRATVVESRLGSSVAEVHAADVPVFRVD